MALDTTSHDIYRGTSGLTLPADVSRAIFEGAVAQSAVMKLAERIELPGRGLAIPVVTGDPVASIVNEAAEKPVSNSTFQTKMMVPKKFAVIELFSEEFKRDFDALYEQLIKRLPGSIAKAFDDQVFLQAGITGFDSLNGVATAADLEDGMAAIAANGYRMTGIAASPLGEVDLITMKTTGGVPMFIDNYQDGKLGRVYGADVVPCSVLPSGMVAGDWTQCKYGIVDDIKVKFSEEATINDGTNQINLWQRNMFAVLVEAELGFVCADDDAFFAVVSASA